jgi:hypothetical protein
MEAHPVFWDLVAKIFEILLKDFFFTYFPGPGKHRVKQLNKEADRDR